MVDSPTDNLELPFLENSSDVILNEEVIQSIKHAKLDFLSVYSPSTLGTNNTADVVTGESAHITTTGSDNDFLSPISPYFLYGSGSFSPKSLDMNTTFDTTTNLYDGHDAAVASDKTCPICLDFYDDSNRSRITLDCGHLMCKFCTMRILAKSKSVPKVGKCPSCGNSYTALFVDKLPISTDVVVAAQSPKVAASISPNASKADLSKKSNPLRVAALPIPAPLIKSSSSKSS